MRLRFIPLLVAALLALVSAVPCHAKYARPQLANVPIERVLTNLADKAAAKPKDPELKFNLARAYAMAYASKTENVEVKAADNDALWFGYEPMNVPFTVKPTEDKKAEELAKKRLAQAIETYEEALKLAPDDLVGKLGHAWCLDQAGQKDAAVDEYRKVVEEGWKKEGKLDRAGLGFRSLVAEAGNYLKPHLDPKRDADEIATLNERIKKIESIPRPVTPIALPLEEGLTASDIEDRDARVRFDADGSGLAREWSWIKPNSGWLVYDKQHIGKIDSALQMFGNVTFWMFWQHGYEPLAALDNNNDGELRGAELTGLAIWRDANQNGISDEGEVQSLSHYGIVAVNCRCEIDSSHPERIEFSRAGVTFADGTTRPTYDVRLKRK
jgi:tetratricopeptide (TPR) repeat protein